MIWWSSETSHTPIGILDLDCPVCGKKTAMRVIRQKKENWFMIIPWWSNEYFATCGSCWNTFTMDKETMSNFEEQLKKADEAELKHRFKPLLIPGIIILIVILIMTIYNIANNQATQSTSTITSQTVAETSQSVVEVPVMPEKADENGLPYPEYDDNIVFVDGKSITIQSGAVRGRILYTDGTPVQNLSVYLFRGSSTESTASTITNDNGYYMFDNVSGGTLYYGKGEWQVADGVKYDVYPSFATSFGDYYWTFDYSARHETVTVSPHKMTTVADIYTTAKATE